MNAIVYLILTRFKNSLKAFFKSPARVVLSLVMLALFGMLLFTGGDTPAAAARSADELGAMIFALYFVMLLLGAKSGLSNGASFFSMADVNNLFPAPVPPRQVLVYGLVRQLGMTFFMAFFLLYQYGWLHQLYGIGLGGLFAILVGYMLTVFCAQLLAMGIYSFSSGNDRRRRVIRAALWLTAAAVALCALRGVPGAADTLGAAVAGANAPWADWFPIAGWMRMFARGVLAGAWGQAALGLGLTAAFVLLFALLLLNLDSDFYEDVLVAAETAQSAITAQKEGRVAENTPSRIRVGRTGINGGQGASAFYFKHRLENRRSRVLFLDAVGLISLALSCAMAWFMRDEGLLPAFLMNLYMLIFGSFTGRWVREMTYPYIFLLPEPPFKKLLMLCAETMVRAAAESALTMALVGLIVRAPLAQVLACMLTRWCFSLYFIAADMLTDRLFGTLPKAMQVFLFFLTLIVAAAPGVVLAVLAGAAAGLAAGILAAGLWMLGVSALVLFLCRGALDNVELGG